ncbi:hypothetical protein MBLNU459_g5480t1 [Dothideomycetes sp. NU459]
MSSVRQDSTWSSSSHDETKTPRPSLADLESQNQEDSVYSGDTIPSKEGVGNSISAIPNGGFLAWLQVLAGFMCFMNSWGLVNAFGVFQDYYSSVLISEVSNSNISWIGSIQAFLLCATTIFAGPIYDNGHPRILVMLGSFLVAVGMMTTSLCSAYWHLLLAQGLCVGIGAGCLFLPAIAIVPSYFTTKKAFAMGIAASGSSFGGIIYPIIFHRLQPEAGYGWATRLIALIAIVTLTIPCICIKARTPPAPRSKLIDFAAFKELPFALFCAASFVGFIGLYVPYFYISQYSSTVGGLDPTISFYMLPITSAGSIVGRILPGLVADRMGPLNVLGSGIMVASMLGFCWIAVQNTLGGLVVWSLLYGAFSGSFVSLQPTTVVSITSDLSTVGGRMGLNTVCSALGILIGTPIAGLLVEQGSWVGVQVFSGGSLFAAAALVVVARLAKTGFVLKSKA